MTHQVKEEARAEKTTLLDYFNYPLLTGQMSQQSMQRQPRQEEGVCLQEKGTAKTVYLTGQY